MHEIYISSKNYEILEEKNGDCYIKDLKNNKYYFREKYFASSNTEISIQEKTRWNYKDTSLVMILLTVILCLIYIIYKYDSIYGYMEYHFEMYVATTFFILLNVFLHELCHITVLKIYGRKVGKIRFRFNFIFPAFSVDTSDSYMLPRYRRFFVYIAGIEINLIICMLVLLLFPEFVYLIKPIVWAALINLVPIGFIKTDGYHIIFNTLMNVKDIRQKPNIAFIVGKYIFITMTFYFIFISLFKSLGMSF